LGKRLSNIIVVIARDDRGRSPGSEPDKEGVQPRGLVIQPEGLGDKGRP
jgi:hypothetical protein